MNVNRALHVTLFKNAIPYLREQRLLVLRKNLSTSNIYFKLQKTPDTDNISETAPNLNNFREIPIRISVKERDKREESSSEDQGRRRTTFASEEVKKFESLASSWWDPNGECKPLHSLNKLRVELIRKGLHESKACDPNFLHGPQPLKGLKILDVGCGGGILCEPLARLGAEVTGLDASAESISAAELHAKANHRISSNTRYIQGTIEEHALKVSEPYDAIVASEVLEHVKSVDYFLESCVSILKPGGSFFITTINKTVQSWLGVIVIAENFGILPRGTHDWEKLVPPQHLKSLLKKFGCHISLIHGMFYVPFYNEWYWIANGSVNYALHAVKVK
ncbi:UNVERIFIED_CONTAM: hypothetical protein RMT77_014136 [Armadillidium vulgare]